MEDKNNDKPMEIKTQRKADNNLATPLNFCHVEAMAIFYNDEKRGRKLIA